MIPPKHTRIHSPTTTGDLHCPAIKSKGISRRPRRAFVQGLDSRNPIIPPPAIYAAPTLLEGQDNDDAISIELLPQERPLSLPEGQDDDDISIELLPQERQLPAQRPCYHESFDNNHHDQQINMTQIGHESFISVKMQEEDSHTTKKRRDRLEQMMTYRKLEEQLELQNMLAELEAKNAALEQETTRQWFNQSINALLTTKTTKKRDLKLFNLRTKYASVKSEGPVTSTTSRTQARKPCPNKAIPRQQSSNVNNQIRKHGYGGWEVRSSTNSSRDDLDSVTIGSSQQAPILSIKEENFDVGKGIKTIKRQEGCQKTRIRRLSPGATSTRRSSLLHDNQPSRKPNRSPSPLRRRSRAVKGTSASIEALLW